MIRWLTITANAAVFVLLLFMFIRQGNWEKWWIVALIAVHISLNTYFIIRGNHTRFDDTMLGLWIRSKKAELRRKIERTEVDDR